ncbi:UNVERIFIED_CONTAM: hypothetical protein Sradi_6777900 [Sesamum radiatum]|uniref:Uncharacterized protein n=1 Tax=Sesamum radiatum TaxID=300843 RepID=A0AAW2JT04_SESRA
MATLPSIERPLLDFPITKLDDNFGAACRRSASMAVFLSPDFLLPVVDYKLDCQMMRFLLSCRHAISV